LLVSTLSCGSVTAPNAQLDARLAATAMTLIFVNLIACLLS
jgi:hypothetical protein